MHYEANVLRDCALSFPEKKKLDKQIKQFKSYQAALIDEKVIVPSKINTFHVNFIRNEHLSEDAKRLRNILDWAWLVFAAAADGQTAHRSLPL